MTILADTSDDIARRVEQARAALREAEERAGVRTVRRSRGEHRAESSRTPTVRAFARPPARDETAPAAPTAPTAPTALAALTAPAVPVSAVSAAAQVVPDERTWPVHDALAALLPTGALQRGTVLAVQGSTSLLLALVARASASGAWTTMVGFPEVGLLAAVDAGIVLGRVALVPRPGPDAAAAVAALVDGMDVVVVGPQAALDDTDRRRLVARARERGTVLVAATAWPGAHVGLTVTGGTWSGADHGAGWLRRRALVVERAGRGGAARPARVEVELPLGRGDWPAYLREHEPVAQPPVPAASPLRLVG